MSKEVHVSVEAAEMIIIHVIYLSLASDFCFLLLAILLLRDRGQDVS
jgi:hypothetical protein